MSVKRLSTRFRVREDVFDNITPNNVVQRDVSAPAGEWKPAAWLPIVFKKSNVSAGEDAFVISSGKVVALDSDNRIVPAGLRAALNVGAAALVYGADDYAYGVTDLVTGVAVASASGATYSSAQVALALIERGLVSSDSITSLPFDSTDAASVTEAINAFISEAIGVAAYDIYVYSGRPEDGDQVFTNYSKQALVQFLTELQMKVPHRTLGSDTTAFDAGAITPVTAQSAAGDMPVAGEVWTETALDDIARYAAEVDGLDVVALKLDNDFIATNTVRTAISCDDASVLVAEKSKLADVKSAGDFYVDTRLGIIFIELSVWTALVTATTVFTITYFHYDVAASGGANSDRYVYLDGEPRPGAFLSYDSHSNFVEMGSAQDALGTSNVRPIARLLNVDVEPKGLLQHVKSAFNLTGMSAASKMPGTATGGFSDAITLATDEQVADQLAVLVLKVN